MEQLGDALAGRYVLVAPQPAQAARRQYHAVDMLADDLVTVRFLPDEPLDSGGAARLRTVDGRRVLDAGTFEGIRYVVVANRLDVTALPEAVVVDELEAMLAMPSAQDHPSPRRWSRPRWRSGRAASSAGRRPWTTRRRVAVLAEIVGIGALAALVGLGAFTTVLDQPVRPGPSNGPGAPAVVEVTTARSPAVTTSDSGQREEVLERAPDHGAPHA